MSWKTLASSMAAKAKSGAVLVGQASKGAAIGLIKGGKSLATGVASAARSVGSLAYNAASDKQYRDRAIASAKAAASQATDYASKLYRSPQERQRVYEGTKGFVVQTKDRFVAARDKARADGRIAEFYGEVVGRGAFELLPISKIGAIGKLGKAGAAAKVASKGSAAARLAKASSVSKVVKAKSALKAVTPCPKAVALPVVPKLKMPEVSKATRSIPAKRKRLMAEFYKPPTTDGFKALGKTRESLVNAATKNPDSKVVILGRNPQYFEKGARKSATYFRVNQETWGSMERNLTPSELWSVNREFMSEQVRQGKNFVLTNDPMKAQGYFALEVRYLQDAGYSFVKAGKKTWKAVK